MVRALDMLASFAILWGISPEYFSHLVISQAIVAPLIFFFISPEVVIYRDYAIWKQNGIGELAARIRHFRVFGYYKFILCVVFSAVVSFLRREDLNFSLKFFSMLWAFNLALAPQIFGADREFLRLSLRLKLLNLLTLVQKVILISGVLLVVLYAPTRIDFLALAVIFSTLFSAFILRLESNKSLKAMGASSEDLKGGNGLKFSSAIRESIFSFSLWQHLFGVILNWVQTMDLFVLSYFSFSPKLIGLYGVAVKLVNFSTAIPMALANMFSVWLGRRLKESNEGFELKKLTQFTSFLILGSVVQGIVLYCLSPKVLSLLSRGRWNADEQILIIEWIHYLLLGTVIMTGTFFVTGWLAVRRSTAKLFKYVSLPLAILGLLSYYYAVSSGGLDRMAQYKVVIMVVYWVLLAGFGFLIRKNQKD